MRRSVTSLASAAPSRRILYPPAKTVELGRADNFPTQPLLNNF